MAYSDFQRSRDACMSVCVCLCVSKYAFGCYLYHMYVNISRTNIVRCACDISSSLKSHSIYASRIYLSIYFYMCMFMCRCRCLCIGLLRWTFAIGTKSHRFLGGCAQSGNNGNGMEFSEANESKCLTGGEGGSKNFEHLHSAKLNRNIQTQYIWIQNTCKRRTREYQPVHYTPSECTIQCGE